MDTKELKFELLEEKVIREMKEERERIDSYFDSSNILLYYKKLRDKLLNIKPKNLKDLYECDYSSKLDDLESKLNSAKKVIEPGSYKDEKIHDLEQEIEAFKKVCEEGSFLNYLIMKQKQNLQMKKNKKY